MLISHKNKLYIKNKIWFVMYCYIWWYIISPTDSTLIDTIRYCFHWSDYIFPVPCTRNKHLNSDESSKRFCAASTTPRGNLHVVDRVQFSTQLCEELVSLHCCFVSALHDLVQHVAVRADLEAHSLLGSWSTWLDADECHCVGTRLRKWPPTRSCRTPSSGRHRNGTLRRLVHVPWVAFARNLF